MDVPIDLDPREVLEHLNALGYDNITKDQLKQFIKDLKKLIKHDLRKIQRHRDEEIENRLAECTVSQHDQPRKEPRNTGVHRKVLGQHNPAAKRSIERSTKSVQTIGSLDELSSTVDSSASAINEGVSRQGAKEPNPAKCNCKAASCPCLQSTCAKSSSSKKVNPPPKPVSSFIRVVPSEARMGKNDPVTLYHYYQNLWSRQNRPGENPHADVRWRIRHKMMAPTGRPPRTNFENRRENPPWVD